jgi:hypothetical protein
MTAQGRLAGPMAVAVTRQVTVVLPLVIARIIAPKNTVVRIVGESLLIHRKGINTEGTQTLGVKAPKCFHDGNEEF